MTLNIPTPTLTFHVELDDGATITVRRHGNAAGPGLLLSHGTGFAIDAYVPYWRQLLDRYDTIVFDFRNHGQNTPVEPSNHHYAQFARDLERVIQAVKARLGERKTAGIFHSM